MPSPCINVCRMDERTGWCEGCQRTLTEIAAEKNSTIIFPLPIELLHLLKMAEMKQMVESRK